MTPHEPLRLLLLGGTTEASRLVERLTGDPRIAPVLSLAGRTQDPVLPAIPVRIGGFGGVAGLVAFLAAERVDVVVDATHPFATRISDHVAQACRQTGVAHAVLTRPGWLPQPNDRWIPVPTLTDAAAALGAAPRRVLLTTGRLGLAAFKKAPQHDYLVRTIDPPAAENCPPRCRTLLARPPFSTEAETALLQAERIDVLVTKNSGGKAGAGKLAAARALGLPVVMVERSGEPDGPVFTDIEAVLGWIAGHRAAP